MRWSIIIGIILCGKMNLLRTTDSNGTSKMRQKRYLAFEKGSAYTIQVSCNKGLISNSPRGLNEIYEYILTYDLPTDLQLYDAKTKPLKLATATTTSPSPYQMPYQPAFGVHDVDMYPYEFGIDRKYWRPNNFRPLKCKRWHYQQLSRKPKKTCIRRSKRHIALSELTTSQRIFYDIIALWSKIQGYLPSYCFMRVLCEAPHILMPKGYSLAHDIIRIFLRFTKPWAWHHRLFGRALKHRYRIEECAALYGPHCRVSWLDHVSTVVHGSEFSVV